MKIESPLTNLIRMSVVASDDLVLTEIYGAAGACVTLRSC